jgi:hypothetical protein
MNYDSKHQALKYHRELFSSLYDVEADKTSSSGYDRQAPTGHLTSSSECGILEGRAPQPSPSVTLCYKSGVHGPPIPRSDFSGEIHV